MRVQTIRFRILVILCAFAVAALIAVLMTVFLTSVTLLRTNEMNYNIESTGRTKASFEIIMDIIDKTARTLSGDADVLAMLRAPADARERSQAALSGRLSPMLLSHDSTVQFISGIHVLGRAPWQLFSSSQPADAEALRALCADTLALAPGARPAPFITGRVDIADYTKMKSVLRYCVPVYGTREEPILGMVVVDIDYAALEEMFLSYSKKNEDKAMIVRTDGEIVFKYPYNVDLTSVLYDHPQILSLSAPQQFTGSVFGTDMYIVSEGIRHTDWRIVRMISMARLTKDTRSIQSLTVRTAVVFIAVSVLLSVVISRILTAPITTLREAFRRAERGDMHVRVQIDSRDEMGELGDSFNTMMQRLDDYFHRELLHQQRKSDMELQVLQAQVNPHFLYNTLDSIKWLAMLQNVNNIAEMTTALIQLLKYNLSKDGPVVTLRDEMDSVSNYLLVQAYRYGEGFTLVSELAEETLSCRVLRFILQPLVENCVLHAFAHMDEAMGTIRIKSFISGDVLHIQVIDDGEGMDPGAMPGGEAEGRRFKSIGTCNIRERIQLNFGDAYGLIYRSAPGQGTVAEITLPARWQGETP